MSSQKKNIADMIDVRAEEITKFVNENGICSVVNAACPSLMGSKVKSVDKSIHDFINKGMPGGDSFKTNIK